jgi:hypothetical protein
VDQPRKERVARNESTYRELNELIADRGDSPRELLLLCECGDAECTDSFVLDSERYEAVRNDPRHFVLLRGHEISAAERVIERRGRCVVVEKVEEVSDVVEERDPRD